MQSKKKKREMNWNVLCTLWSAATHRDATTNFLRRQPLVLKNFSKGEQELLRFLQQMNPVELERMTARLIVLINRAKIRSVKGSAVDKYKTPSDGFFKKEIGAAFMAWGLCKMLKAFWWL